jgi:hypothetical protein
MTTPPTELTQLTEENRAEYTKARAEAYQAAATKLREARREEYDRYVVSEMAKRGYAWSPRAGAARERALERIRELAAKNGLGVDEVAAALVPEDKE